MASERETATGEETKPYELLLSRKVKVVNVGLEGFAKDLYDCDIGIVQIDWRPPAGGDPEMAALLAKLGV